MPLNAEPRREHPSTYFVQDRSNLEELHRLQVQDALITAHMGGVLPEQPDLTRFRRVLDVGCGAGGWLIELAQTVPSCTRLVGVDASLTFVQEARAQARAARVADRVEFHVMDALRMLEFPDHFFDLVNQRFGMSWLRTWDWPKLLLEYRRVAAIGGAIRLTESDRLESSSPALNTLSALLFQASFQAGHLFRQEPNGVTGELARLLDQYGLQRVQTRACPLGFRAGTVEGEGFAENLEHVFRTGLPFVHKWTAVPDDYDALFQQMRSEIRQPDFVATMNLLTAWGQAFFS